MEVCCNVIHIHCERSASNWFALIIPNDNDVPCMDSLGWTNIGYVFSNNNNTAMQVQLNILPW